jgi:hypothetical protein
MTNHPKDRHVLAAAVRCNAEVIVTLNVKDFPRTALDPYSITAMGPSTFLRNLYDLDPEVVANTLARQATSINKTVEYVLERLSVNAPGFVSFFKTIGTPGRKDRKDDLHRVQVPRKPCPFLALFVQPKSPTGCMPMQSRRWPDFAILNWPTLII